MPMRKRQELRLVLLPAILILSFIGMASAGYQNWQHSQEIFLNTKTSGAAVTSNQCAFPVLVKLDGSSFNFSQARGQGQDLRFAKPSGTALSYEIEQWDSAGGKAAIWVKTDTVYGSDSVHSFTMYWGKSDAVDSSSAARVFDTTAGFVGVWHLNNDPAGTAPQIVDGTANGINGTSGGSMQSSALVNGAVGKGIEFDGANDYLSFGNGSKVDITGENDVAVSAWVRLDNTTDWYTIIGKGDHQYHLQYRPYTIWEFCIYDTDWRGAQKTHVPSSSTFYNICGVYKASLDSLFLYKNGERVAAARATSISSSRNDDLTIGKNSENNGRFWDGVIDEARLAKTAWSDDWVRLCYQNQQANQTLVVFGQEGGGQQFTLNTTGDGNGTTSPSGDTLISAGDTTDITATPNEDYEFLYWSVDSGTVQFGDSLDASTWVRLTNGSAKIKAHFQQFQHGLSAVYFGDLYSLEDSITRIDTVIDFNWEGTSPDPSFGINNYRALWTGRIKPQYSETYTFYIYMDDGARLWVNDNLIIDQWNNQWPAEFSGQIALTAGVKYNIMMEYHQDVGSAQVHFRWSSASVGKQIVPKAKLYATGYTGTRPVSYQLSYRFSRNTINPVYGDVATVDFELLDSTGIDLVIKRYYDTIVTIGDVNQIKAPGSYRLVWNGTKDNTFGGTLSKPYPYQMVVRAKKSGQTAEQIGQKDLEIINLP